MEKAFGWLKQTGPLRKVKLRGLPKVDWLFLFSCAAFNLLRIPKLRDPVCVNANLIPGYAAQKPTQRPSYPRQLDRSEPFTRRPMLIPISKTRFSTSS